jgi:hypothetical protein
MLRVEVTMGTVDRLLRRLAHPKLPSTAPGTLRRDSGQQTGGTALLLVRHLSKTALGLGMLALVAFAPIQKLLQTSSIEAVVNARVITLLAPIDGEVQTGPSPLEFGTPFARGDVLLRIINDRADRSRVDDLIHEIERLKDERPSVVARLADARMRLTDLTEQIRLFADARTLQLDAPR